MNRVTITPMKFTAIRTQTETFGFLAYDNESDVYNNGLGDIPDDDMQFLAQVIWSSRDVDDPTLYDLLDYVYRNQLPIDVDVVTYEWDDIKHLFNDWYSSDDATTPAGVQPQDNSHVA